MPFWINIIAMVIGLVISGLVGLILIPYLKKLHFGQTILEIGPAWHKSKEGTPTMGGFMFIGNIGGHCRRIRNLLYDNKINRNGA